METQISTLLQQHDGYIAESTVDRTQGEQLSGRWRVRIPVEHFDTFLDAVQPPFKQIAKEEARRTDRKLVEDSTGEIKDVIEVERELARVRGEIEQMEGRLRFLSNRTELTTVSIVAREVQDYVPPQSPTFTNRIRQAWVDSLLALRVFGEDLWPLCMRFRGSL